MKTAAGPPAAEPSGSPGRDFTYSATREPHAGRAKEIMKRHPAIRELVGRNPWSALLVLLLVAFQTGAAWLLREQAAWVVVGAAFAVGAFVSHTLWVLIHECSHNLVFRNATWNRLVAIVANFPHLLPSAVSFQKYHLKHHAFQGVYELDADLPNRWEARLVGSTFVGKALWLLLFPVFQVTRPPRLKEIRLFDGWVFVNIGAQLAYDAAVLLLLGSAFLVQQWRLSSLENRWKSMQPRVRLVEGLQTKSRAYRPWFDESALTLRILLRVVQAFPEDGAVSAKNVQIKNGNEVICAGQARDNQALLQLLDSLSAFPQVADLKTQQVRGKSPLQYILTFRWIEGGRHED